MFIFNFSGHIWSSEELGQRTSKTGQSKHCDCFGREQIRPGTEENGRI